MLSLIDNGLSQAGLLLAEAAPAQSAPGGGAFGNPLLLLAIFGLFYFLVLRPMKKDEEKRKDRVTEIKKGVEVVLQGGMVGRISNWDDDLIAVVEIADKVKVKVLKKDIQDTLEHVKAGIAKDGDKDGKNKKDKDDK
jgi:preprotein translocase subunit YajC